MKGSILWTSGELLEPDFFVVPSTGYPEMDFDSS